MTNNITVKKQTNKTHDFRWFVEDELRTFCSLWREVAHLLNMRCNETDNCVSIE